MASSCPTTRLRSWFSRSSACLPVLLGSSSVSFVILHLLPASLNTATSGGAKEVASWGPHLYKVSVRGFLALYTKCCPRHRGKPLRVDVFFALLAGPKAAFLDTSESRTGFSKLVEFPVELTNRECAL